MNLPSTIAAATLALVSCMVLSLSASAQIRLPRLVRDSMVLQRDAYINVWGWASRREKIRIQFKGHSYRTTADNNGNWLIRLAPAPAGGPYTMDISGRNKITLHDILIGDVG
jgi:sialate O-acetylesterase